MNEERMKKKSVVEYTSADMYVKIMPHRGCTMDWDKTK